MESSDDVQMIEQIEQIEQIETEIEEEVEEEEETVFTLDLTDDSECEDKEYLGNALVLLCVKYRWNIFQIRNL